MDEDAEIFIHHPKPLKTLMRPLMAVPLKCDRLMWRQSVRSLVEELFNHAPLHAVHFQSYAEPSANAYPFYPI